MQRSFVLSIFALLKINFQLRFITVSHIVVLKLPILELRVPHTAPQMMIQTRIVTVDKLSLTMATVALVALPTSLVAFPIQVLEMLIMTPTMVMINLIKVMMRH